MLYYEVQLVELIHISIYWDNNVRLQPILQVDSNISEQWRETNSTEAHSRLVSD